MRKRICSVFAALIFVCVFSLSASAKYYTDDLPSYVSISGGAYFEVYDTNLGKQVTVVFPIEFKDDHFGFSLSGSSVASNIVNVTNSTVYGVVYTSDGEKYSCRASRQDVIEYSYEYSTGRYEYRDLSPKMSTLTNSNMQFLTDNKDLYNQSFVDYEKVVAFLLLSLVLLQLVSLFVLALRKGR